MPNELSVRTTAPGRSIADEVIPASSWDDGAGRVVILVHGYNTSEDEARASYASFEEELARALAHGRERRLGTVWKFFWPGDDPRAAISLSTYNVRVEEAERSAERLADFLAKRPSTLRVILVAHSLGCRVALETLRRIQQNTAYKGALIEAVFLLAAAVPTRQCEGVASYSVPLSSCQEHVASSRRDRVLRLAFRPGQYLAANGASWYERGPAVGRDGGPQNRWRRRLPTELGHTDYWSSDEVARWICDALRVSADRRLGSRPNVTYDASGSRRLTPAHRLASRCLGRRYIA